MTETAEPRDVPAPPVGEPHAPLGYPPPSVGTWDPPTAESTRGRGSDVGTGLADSLASFRTDLEAVATEFEWPFDSVRSALDW